MGAAGATRVSAYCKRNCLPNGTISAIINTKILPRAPPFQSSRMPAMSNAGPKSRLPLKNGIITSRELQFNAGLIR